jgi:hypothetical protein
MKQSQKQFKPEELEILRRNKERRRKQKSKNKKKKKSYNRNSGRPIFIEDDLMAM